MNQLSYQQCYDILSLPTDASWSEASTAYRKLVQRWHPDRYEGDDNQMAEDRFVELTVAFNKLRDYHRTHEALPFIDANMEFRSASNDELHSAQTSANATTHTQQNSTFTQTDAFHSDIRRDNRNRKEHAKQGISAMTKIIVVMLLFAVVLVTLLFNMDNRDLQKLEDEAREHRAILNSQ